MLARAILAAVVLMLALAEPGAVQSTATAEHGIARYFWRIDTPEPTPTLGSELDEANERLAAVRRRRVEVERLERVMRDFVKSLDALPTPPPEP